MSVQKITKDNFDQLVMKARGKVLLDFWAPWCGPCRMVGPIVEEIAQENESLVVGKVNVDEEMGLAMAFQVSSIPMLAVMENGKMLSAAVGYRSKADIEALLGI